MKAIDWLSMRKIVTVFMLGCLFFSLTACSGLGNDETAAGSEQYTVTVMYYDEQQFFRDYGELLFAKYPNIEIEVVGTQSLYATNSGPDFDYNEAFKELVEQRKPDVLMLNANQYKDFYEEGLLLDLEPLIEADEYDIETVVPGVIELLKEQAGGRLHGLSPRFYNVALYYNIGLFDTYGIEHPRDHMSWEEVLQLARRFPTDGDGENRIYGFGGQEYMDYTQFLQSISSTEGLVYVDPLTKRMTINNEDWKRIFQLVVDAYKSGAIAPSNDPFVQMQGSIADFLLRNKFVAGQSAMMVEGVYLLDQLRQARNSMPDREPVDYGLVTAPVDPDNREVGGQMQVYNIFAINPSSEETSQAWEIVKYMNSEEMARIKSKSTMELLTRTTYMTEKDGRNIEAFYALKPPPTNLYDGYEDLPSAFNGQFYSLLGEQLRAAIEDGKPIDEVLETLDAEGQKLLMQEDPISSEE